MAAYVLAAMMSCDYDAHFGDCVIACTPSSGCPDGFTCGSEGLCRALGTSATCASMRGPFGTPTLVSNLSDPSYDDDPTLTADLLEIYFNSLRAGGPGLGDVWKATRASPTFPFGTPVPVTQLNSPSVED